MAIPSSIISHPNADELLSLPDIFGSAGPLEVDVGSGKGRFLLARAAAHPTVNFIGIDRRLKRVQKVDRKISRAGLANVRLLCMEASRVIGKLLPPLSVSTYFIFFPDPWPKRRHHQRRLLKPSFLDEIERTLAPGGEAHLATDHQEYFADIRGLFGNDKRFREIPPFEPPEDFRTEFEIVFTGLNAKIGRCSFQKPPSQ